MLAEIPKFESGVFQQDFLLADWRISPSLNQISHNGTSVRVEPKVMNVLVCLAANAGKLVTKEQLIDTVWKETFVSDQALTTAIWQLRHVFGESSKDPQLIQTIPKTGYRLLAVPAVVSETRESVSPADATPAEKPTEHAAVRRMSGRLLLLATMLVTVCAVMIYIAISYVQRAQSHDLSTTLVVLPFTNLSGDPQQEYFSDGMTEEMILQLGRLRPDRLSVIARATAMSYKNSGKRIDQIAKELNVAYLLEGSVRRDGNRVWVSVDLVDAHTQQRVWDETYEQDWKDILLLQSGIARSVAQQLKLRLSPDQNSALAASRPVNQAAHERYLKGRYHWNRRTKDDLFTAISYFEDAARIDPTYAAAYVGIADSYWALHEWGIIDTGEAALKGKPAALKAIELDPSSAQSHAAMGAAAMNYDWDWATAGREFKRAIELDANFAPAHQWYAELLSAMGRPAEAIAEIRRAQALDPQSLIINSVAGMIMMHARRYDEALAECKRALQIDPEFHAAHYYLANVHFAQGRMEEAKQEYAKAAIIFGHSPSAVRFRLAVQATLKWRAGDKRGALRIADELAKGTPDRSNGYSDMAALYASLGEADRAFAYLTKALERRERNLRLVKVNPAFDSIRSDSRYAELLHNLHFDEQRGSRS